MTISTSYSVLSYSGNGSTTDFAVSWQFFADSDLVVTLVSSAGVETVQTITTHYTVVGGADDNSGAPSTGTVTMLTAPASGSTLRITRDTAKTQSTNLSNVGSFDADSVEWMADRLTLIVQEVLAGGSDVYDGITGDVMRFVSSGATDYWDAESQLIRNVATATGSTDAVPYGQLLSLITASPVMAEAATGNVTIETAGKHIVMANASTATVTIGSGVDWCMVSRSSQSAANVTVVSEDGPAVTVEGDGTGVVINAQVGPVIFITDPGDANNIITVTPQVETWGTSTPLISKTVAELGSITATAGLTYYASNGRKNGEGSGAGTGVMVFGDGTAWRAVDTGATVAA